MSFFTNDEYASFHQTRGVASHLPKNASNTRRVDNASFTSSSSTSSMLSELDPFSPISMKRAADPWYDNILAPATDSFNPVQANTSPPASRFFITDGIEEDWGDFVNCNVADKCASIIVDSHIEPETKFRHAKGRGQFREDPVMTSAGWSHLPLSGSNDQPASSLFDEDDDLNDGSFMPYHLPPRQHESPSLIKSIFSRLASFSSTSSSLSSPAVGSVLGGRRHIFGSFSATTALPARNYDSYDVTFEKGPIGLELETDWYGRQAVVKGFKKINNEDGPAMACGVIRIGDVLTAINGASCLELGFQETLAQLRRVTYSKHTLHFKSLEAAGDLSIYNQDSDIIQAKRFIHEHKEKFYRAPVPLPNRELILGCVERLRGERVTTFNFHREDTGEFLLACSCVNERTGEFLFHTLQDAHLREWRDLPKNEDSAVFIGRLEPNFIGTEFTLLDHQQKRRNELGFIEYSTNVLGRVPNFLKVAFPKQPHLVGDEDADDKDEPGPRPRPATTGMGSNNAVFNTSMMDRNGAISERYKRIKQTRSLSFVEKMRHFSLEDVELDLSIGGSTIATTLAAAWHDDDDHRGRARAMRMNQLRTRGAAHRRDIMTPYGAVEQEDFDCDLITFETRKPSWNEDLGAWTLNFQGRVKLASKKNFLIVAEQGNDAMEVEFGEDTTYLRFGKVTKSRFTLDYQSPLSPLLALAIACSSFAHKIAVT